MIAVSFEPGERVAQLADQMQLPFPVLSDPERKTYDAYGLGSGSWLRIFSPGTVWTYLKHFARGGKYDQKYGHKSSDLKQLGGNFILDASGSVTLEHRSTAPHDRPPVSQLVGMLGGTQEPGTSET